MAERIDEPTIGFGALWNRTRPGTWSHTPLSLLRGLQATGAVVDLGYDDQLRRALHIARHLRLEGRRIRSAWRYQESVINVARASIAAVADDARVDAILTVGDIGVFDQPFFIYQDLSYDLVKREIDNGNRAAEAQFGLLKPAIIERLRLRQHCVFAESSVILAMSHWYADSLINHSGIAPERVHVVHPGATASGVAPIELDRRRDAALFVGRDFERKGGELAVEAIAQLRRAGREITLTVVGPSRWPLKTEVPDWIEMRGPQSVDVVAQLMAEHAVFVMPTRFEAFGIVFAEALRAGTPAVGPDRFAVPEIVRDGEDGALFSRYTVDDVVGAIETALTDSVRETAFVCAAARAAQFNWDRAAREARTVIAASIS